MIVNCLAGYSRRLCASSSSGTLKQLLAPKWKQVSYHVLVALCSGRELLLDELLSKSGP
jgi:hypothetical protein